MIKLFPWICGLFVVAIGGCSRTPKPTNAAAPPIPPAASPTAPTAAAAAGPAGVAAEQGGGVVARRSEFVAAGKPAAGCRDCNKADGGASPQYHGKPQMKLDDKTLKDVRATVDATCELLEAGVAILEKNVKTPDRATAALKAFQGENKTKIEAVFHRADEVRNRLRGAGYDQDIPAEVQPAFNKRMGAIQVRLEKMRKVYAQHSDVLEAFGALFPRRR